MLRPSTFRVRLLITLLSFVLLAEIAVGALILRTTYHETLAQARVSLRVGNRVLDQLMTLRSNQLLSNVNVLTSDFGFKSAVATNDAPTLRSTLANFGSRVQADVAVLADPTGQLIATVPASAKDRQSSALAELLDDARRQGRAAGLVMVHNRPAQFVLVPVRAPRLIAWTGMGFAIDRDLASQLASLTGLNVNFEVIEDGHRIFSIGSADAPGADIQSSAFLVTRHTLLDTGNTRLTVMLCLSRASVLASYYSLARSLALIFLITLLVSALVAVWLARKLSDPVRELSEFATSIAAGEYSTRPESRGMGELDVLTDALSDMQSAVQEREGRIRHQATHDALTALPNRATIRQRLEEYLRSGDRFAVVRLSVRNFGEVNSALGYQLGDEILRTIAKRLTDYSGHTHAIARAEGNHFLVLMRSDADEHHLYQQIELLREYIQHPMHLLDTPLNMELEIGIVIAPEQATDADMVWRRSTIARDISRQRRGRTVFYAQGMDERQTRELTIIRDLETGIAQGQLHLVYQPKMALSDGSIPGVECLSRWHHPTLGFVPPDEFVGLAERSGQIRKLTRWLVDTTNHQLDTWHRAGLDVGISLNMSADELADPSLYKNIMPLLERRSRHRSVTLEVTESAILRDPEKALHNLHALRASGARIAVDDFGTGYSSFAQLKQLGPDKLKIDKSLVLELATTIADQHIVRSVIDLGHRLGVDVVAEGIENDASWRFLAENGADVIQGYHLARPMHADALQGWLASHKANKARWILSDNTRARSVQTKH